MLSSLQTHLESLLNSGDWSAILRIALVRGADSEIAKRAYPVVPKEMLQNIRDLFEHPNRSVPKTTSFASAEQNVECTWKILSLWPETYLCRPTTFKQFEGEASTVENGMAAAKQLNGIANEIDDDALSGKLHNIVADGLRERYRFAEAAENYKTALEKLGKANQASNNAFMEELGQIHRSLGVTHLHQRNFRDSEHCFVSTISTFTELIDEIPNEAFRSIILAHQNMGTMYQQMEMFDEAKYRFEKAFNLVHCGVLCQDDQETKEFAGCIASSLGGLWQCLGDPHQAQFYLGTAEELFESVSSTLGHQQCLDYSTTKLAVANLAMGSGMPKTAVERCTDAVRVIVEGGVKDCVEGMVGIAKAIGSRGVVNLNIGELKDAEEDLANEVKILASLASTNDFFIETAARADVSLSIAYRMQKKWNLARQHCGRAIYFFSKMEEPVEANVSLAKAYWNFGQIQVESESPYSAVCYFEKAARIYLAKLNNATEASVLDAVDCFYLLGKALVCLNDRLTTRSVIDKALYWLRQGQRLLVENLFRSPIDLPMRRKAREPSVRLMEYLFHALTIKYLDQHDTEDLAEAFYFSEQTRMQSANELTVNQQVLQYPDLPEALAERYASSMFKLKQISEIYAEHEQFLDPYDSQRETAGEDSEADEFESFREMKRTTLSEYQKCVEEIQALEPGFTPGASYTPITVNEIQNRIGPETAAIQLTVTERGTDAIVITKCDVKFCRLPNCDQNWIDATGVAWLAEIQEFDISVDHDVWNSLVRKQLKDISRFCIGPIVKTFSREVTEVIFAPHKTFHMYPITACPIKNGRFGETFAVSVVPSLSHYFQNIDAPSNLPGNGKTKATIIDSKASNLSLLKKENQFVEGLFDDAARLEFYDDVPVEFYDASARSEVWHFSGHGSFLKEEPFNSYLELGDGQPGITIREVLFRLRMPRTKLVVLSACESGMLRPHYQDEYLSFPLAFLCTGAKCVVASLWQIGDLPTYLFICKFYEKIVSGQSVSTSLANTQKWLRGDKDERGDAIQDGRALRAACQSVLAEIDSDVDHQTFEYVLQEFERGFSDSPPFGDEIYWSSFVALGQGTIRICD